MLAQKADRSRRYGRIGSVSQQQTNTPRLLQVTAHYPLLKRTEILHTDREGTRKGLEATPRVQLSVSATVPQPFYLYGTFDDGQAAYLSFFKRITSADSDFAFTMPSFARNPKIHASLTPPPPHYSHQYISEAKSEWIRSRALHATDVDFFNLGFQPVNPGLWQAGETMPNLEGSTKSEYWSGRKSDFDPRIHGFGGFKMNGTHESALYGGAKDYLPFIHTSPPQRLTAFEKEDRYWHYFWFVIAEFVPGKGWLVLDKTQPTLKAGHPYCIMGARYKPKNVDPSFSTYFIPAEGAAAPEFNFMSSQFANMFSTDRGVKTGDWLPVRTHKDGYVPFGTSESPHFPEALGGVTVKELYNDNGAGWFRDSLGQAGDELRSILQSSGVPEQNTPVLDFFSSDVEYYDFGSSRWQDSRPSRTCDSKGRFAWYFRFKRQLSPTHPDVATQPDWSIDKTADAYPTLSLRDGKKSIGRTFIGFQQEQTPAGRFSLNDTPMFRITASFPDLKTQFGSRELRATTDTMRTLRVADPDNFTYSTNQQIDRVFFEDAMFTPGKRVVLIGKGLDRTNFICVSKEKSLAALAAQKGLSTPEALLTSTFAQQFSANAVGQINTSSVGYLKPISVVTADQITTSGYPSGFQSLFQNIFGDVAPENLFSLFLDGDVRVAGYTRSEIESLPVDVRSKLVDKVAVRFSALDNTDKRGRQVLQMRDKPTHFTILDESNDPHEFPFSIGIFEIPAGYNGPAPVIAAKKDGQIISFAQAKEMMTQAATAQDITGFSGFGGFAALGGASSGVEDALKTFHQGHQNLDYSGFTKDSQTGRYSVYREFFTAENGIESVVEVLWLPDTRTGISRVSVETRAAAVVEETKTYELTTRNSFNLFLPFMVDYFESEVTRVSGETRTAPEYSETMEIVQQVQLGERQLTMHKITATGGMLGSSTKVFYVVILLESDGSEVSKYTFDQRGAAEVKFTALSGGKKLVSGLEFIHDPSTPDTVYYRFLNVLGRGTTGFEEDLSAEIQLQLAKENYGLSMLEQLLTDAASIGGEEDVEPFDMGEQQDAERPPALIEMSLPKWFGKFKTDSLLRKYTLLPYGSRTPIDEK